MPVRYAQRMSFTLILQTNYELRRACAFEAEARAHSKRRRRHLVDIARRE